MIINTYDQVYGSPTGQTAISWKYRDFLSATIKHASDPADLAPESVTYNLTIRGADNQILRTVNDLTESEYVYSAVDEVSDSGGLQTKLTFEIETVLNGEVSLYKAKKVLNR